MTFGGAPTWDGECDRHIHRSVWHAVGEVPRKFASLHQPHHNTVPSDGRWGCPSQRCCDWRAHKGTVSNIDLISKLFIESMEEEDRVIQSSGNIVGQARYTRAQSTHASPHEMLSRVYLDDTRGHYHHDKT